MASIDEGGSTTQVDERPAILDLPREHPQLRRSPPPDVAIIDLRTEDDRRARRRFGATLALVVVLAAALRAIALPAALPYQAYIDEGHVVKRADHLVAGPTWDPAWYRYPTLVPSVIGAVTLGLSVAEPEVRRQSEAADRSPYLDVLSPGALLVGRLLVLAASVGTVLAAALLATRLAGRSVGLVAAILVGAMPALVSRGAIVAVDTPATFFVMAATLAAFRVNQGPRPLRAAAVAGACCGLAFTSKYTALGVIAVVVVGAALAPRVAVAQRAARIGVAALTAVAAAVVSMPALPLRYGHVRADIDRQAEIYAQRSTITGYGRELTGNDEVGWLLLVLAVAGIVVLLRRPRSRPLTIGWLAFASLSAFVLLREDFQPTRNLLPLLPFVGVAAAVAVVTAVRRALRPVSWGWVRVGWVAPVVAGMVAVAMIGLGLGATYTARISVVDSRSNAVDWLAANAVPGQRVLVAEELGIAPWELGRIPAEVTVLPALDPAAVPDIDSYQLVVMGSWRAGPTAEPSRFQRITVASFGKRAAAPSPDAWRGNDLAIEIAVPFRIT